MDILLKKNMYSTTHSLSAGAKIRESQKIQLRYSTVDITCVGCVFSCNIILFKLVLASQTSYIIDCFSGSFYYRLGYKTRNKTLQVFRRIKCKTFQFPFEILSYIGRRINFGAGAIDEILGMRIAANLNLEWREKWKTTSL
jgi:hypothetical protein